MTTKKHLVRAAGTVGFLTLISRVLGMIRDVLCARSFGTSWQWDGFIFAFMIPNFFRRLVGEGALSSSFIPVYSETAGLKGQDAANRYANVTLTLVASFFVFFLLAIELALNLVLQWIPMSQTLTLAVDLLRIFFPYLLIMSLCALGMGILNSHKHFFAPSAGPILMNLFWIVGVIWIVPNAGSDLRGQLRWLSFILLASAVAQLMIQLPPLYRSGYRVKLIWDFACEEIKKTKKLFVPMVFGFAVFQINILVDMSLGLMIGPGANSSLWYGNRLMQFPLGIFAIAMGSALLPTISAQTARNELSEAKKSLGFALRSVFFIVIPSSIGLIFMREPIVQLLFERGAFDAVSTMRTASVLLFYSIGLFAYSGQKIITTGFYAAQDSKTPVNIAVIALLTNIVLNLILMGPMKEAGLALATSLSGILQFLLLIYFYQKKMMKLNLGVILSSFLRITISALVMGEVAYLSYGFMTDFSSPEKTVSKVSCLLGSIGLAMIVYGVTCLMFKVKEMREAVDWIQAKRS